MVYTVLMKKEMVIGIAGALVALLPFAGLPSSWDTPLFVFFGAVIILCAVLIRSDALRRPSSGPGVSFRESEKLRSDVSAPHHPSFS